MLRDVIDEVSPSPTIQRLDKVILEICEQLSYEVSRAQVQGWIEAGAVAVDGEIKSKANTRVAVGARVRVLLPKVIAREIESDEIPLSIIHEDEDILVISKPAGLVVHPGAGISRGTLANALAAYFKKSHIAPPERMGIVHRLDKETSGVLVIGKTPKSVMKLSRQFAERQTEKTYLALVYYTPRRPIEGEGVIDQPIGRHATHRTKMAVREDGRRAITKWRVIEHFTSGALLEVNIETGRTHQIRVHMEFLHAPIVGDKVYGNFQGMPIALVKASEAFNRHALHAWKLKVRHPSTNEMVHFEAALDPAFTELLDAFRSYGRI